MDKLNVAYPIQWNTSAPKRNEILIYVILMNLSKFTLDEKSDTKDYMFYASTYMKCPGKEMYRKRKQRCWKWRLTAEGLEGFFLFLFSFFF